MTPLLLALTAAAVEPDFAALRSAEGWQEIATRDADFGQVRVLHREIGGAQCLQGIGKADVPLARIFEVLDDVPSALEWSHADLVFSEVVGRPEGGVDLMQYIDIPNWTLVADRYWIVRARTERGPEGAARFTWTRVPVDTYPDAKAKALGFASNAMEPPVNWGEWAFQPTEGGLEVRYRGCSDIGGAIPQWLQKAVAQRTLPDTVADLVREAKKRADKGAAPVRPSP
ncbi:MAG: hypothetical protein H6732_04430 [Alphaproteobacteria bacterium]|nr:hypothetical protein [Alphaproteobacteria bacterium]